MTDLKELLECVRQATGPDRAIDLALAAALVPDVIVMRQRDDDSGADPYTHWEYTGSIDDALALVERKLPGAMWRILCDPDTGDMIEATIVPDGLRAMERQKAPTAPLAILSALLTALISREPQP